MESSRRELSKNVYFYYAQINLKKIVAHLVQPTDFFARPYNLHVKIDHSPIIRKIGSNFHRTHLSMVKLYRGIQSY